MNVTLGICTMLPAPEDFEEVFQEYKKNRRRHESLVCSWAIIIIIISVLM